MDTNEMSLVEILDKYKVSCFDDDVVSCLDEVVVAWLDKSNTDNAYIDFILTQPLV